MTVFPKCRLFPQPASGRERARRASRMAGGASWPIPQAAGSASRTGCCLSHGGVWGGNCCRAGDDRPAPSANHGPRRAAAHR